MNTVELTQFVRDCYTRAYEEMWEELQKEKEQRYREEVIELLGYDPYLQPEEEVGAPHNPCG